MTTTVIIGKQAEGNNTDPEAPALASLEKDKFWPVDIAYFDESKNGGEEVPEYRISFKLHKNGVTRDLRDGLRRLLDDRQAGQSEAVRREARGSATNSAAALGARGVGFIDTFVPPSPSKPLLRVMTGLNRVFMLKGIPVLRDLWPFSSVPPFRGLANVRHLDFPAADEARLAAICGPGKATFITPNHPEFFTDWMIDKEILARVSPLAAAWATHVRRQWHWPARTKILARQQSDRPDPRQQRPGARSFCRLGAQGHGVLLHPEGGVGWHGDHVAPLMPGAVEMALEALAEGRKSNPQFQAWVAPVVWKLAFTKDVEKPLLAECAYVERRLKVGAGASGLSLPQRVYRIYETLLARDEERLGLTAAPALPFAERHAAVTAALSAQLAGMLGCEASAGPDELLRLARRKLRDKAMLDRDAATALRKSADALARVGRIGPFAFAGETITQEGIAEHLKRIRNDYCNGSRRDTLNRFVPQPAGPRRAYIRVPEALGLHEFKGSEDEALALLRSRMQATLDALNAEIEREQPFRRYPNPFHQPQLAAA